MDTYEPPEASGAVGRLLDRNEIFTIGHSTHESEGFIALLKRARIGILVDVRRHPGSRRVPWTRADRLEQFMSESSIGYLHLPELGGRRRPTKESMNTGWRNAQFQGYADHMRSPEFHAALDQLESRAGYLPAAIMCAEAQWWRCHRRLISDTLVARGWRVLHIDSRGAQQEHALTDFAVVEGDELRYPAPADEEPGKKLRRTDANQEMHAIRESSSRSALGVEA
ncbi:MAG: DUF488 domain-containing protein [Solirubrobacteraceae bacterium]